MSSSTWMMVLLLSTIILHHFLRSTSSKSRKRKKIDLNKYEEIFIKSLTQNTEQNLIDGFVSRLESLYKLSYKSRSKLEIEFLSRPYEIEEDNERDRRNKM